MLAGLDFSFSFPFVDVGTYFPGLAESPAAAPDLWRLVDDVCAGEANLYAGAFVAA